MEQILEKLCQTSGILGCFLASLDGLVIASQWHEGRELDLFGATMAELYRNLEDGFGKLGGGKAQLFTIERTSDKIFVKQIEGADFLLVILTEPRINMGLVRMEIQEAAQKLRANT